MISRQYTFVSTYTKTMLMRERKDSTNLYGEKEGREERMTRKGGKIEGREDKSRFC